MRPIEAILAVLTGVLLLNRESKGSAGYPGSGSTRGMRNNNPGNIRISANDWIGKIPVSQNTDGAFEQFKTMFYGVRAALVNMRTHYGRGKDTIYSLVTTWAPYSDNPAGAVDNYVSVVADYAGLKPNQRFVWNKSNVSKIAYRMFLVENAGAGPNMETIKRAYDAI